MRPSDAVDIPRNILGRTDGRHTRLLQIGTRILNRGDSGRF
jgi:hypothetical protein